MTKVIVSWKTRWFQFVAEFEPIPLESVRREIIELVKTAKQRVVDINREDMNLDHHGIPLSNKELRRFGDGAVQAPSSGATIMVHCGSSKRTMYFHDSRFF